MGPKVASPLASAPHALELVEAVGEQLMASNLTCTSASSAVTRTRSVDFPSVRLEKLGELGLGNTAIGTKHLLFAA